MSWNLTISDKRCAMYRVYLFTCLPVYLCTCVPVYLFTFHYQLMQRFHGALRVLRFNDHADRNVRRAMRNREDIDIVIAKLAEDLTRDSGCVARACTNHGDDRDLIRCPDAVNIAFGDFDRKILLQG